VREPGGTAADQAAVRDVTSVCQTVSVTQTVDTHTDVILKASASIAWREAISCATAAIVRAKHAGESPPRKMSADTQLESILNSVRQFFVCRAAKHARSAFLEPESELSVHRQHSFCA